MKVRITRVAVWVSGAYFAPYQISVLEVLTIFSKLIHHRCLTVPYIRFWIPCGFGGCWQNRVFLTSIYINAFSLNVPFLYPLKTSENLPVSDTIAPRIQTSSQKNFGETVSCKDNYMRIPQMI